MARPLQNGTGGVPVLSQFCTITGRSRRASSMPRRYPDSADHMNFCGGWVFRGYPLVTGRIRGRFANLQLVDDFQHLDQFVAGIDEQLSSQDILSASHQK